MMDDLHHERHPASFRDPSGYVFWRGGAIYRAVQKSYLKDYEHLISSGFYSELRADHSIIPHEEVDRVPLPDDVYKILKPEQLSFWTYPYEWCFGQLKDAALLSLKLAAAGLRHDMILKDALANNIQFVRGKPVLIDSLSFELYEEGEPWPAFQQFCAHFLYPLLVFQEAPQLSPSVRLAYPDGFSAALTASLLPWKSRLSWNRQLYVFLAAALSNKAEKRGPAALKISKQKILQNIAQLTGFISSLKLPERKTAWSSYYEESLLDAGYLEAKKALITSILREQKPGCVIDIGCNTGVFSLLAATYTAEVIAMDNDATSVDILYGEVAKRGLINVQVLVADIANPSPALGWANSEQRALLDRLSGDMVFALALVHHLAIAKNVPLEFISSLLARTSTRWTVVEFVPKTDPKVQTLLQNRKDIFPNYTKEDFEETFSRDFRIQNVWPVTGTERLLYLMEKK